MNNILKVLEELDRFSGTIVTIGNPLIEKDVLAFETQYSLVLPNDFKIFLKRYNGFSLMGAEILGFNRNQNSIDTVYNYEHTLVAVPQYHYLVPFNNDGRGNFYCHDTRYCERNPKNCPVIFWVSNYIYSETDQPEVTHNSFSDFVQDVLIDWTLEDYNYDGSDK